jgi:hypothetical protein
MDGKRIVLVGHSERSRSAWAPAPRSGAGLSGSSFR